MIYRVGNEWLSQCLCRLSHSLRRTVFIYYDYLLQGFCLWFTSIVLPVQTLHTDHSSCSRLFTLDRYSLDYMEIQRTNLRFTWLSLGSFLTRFLCTPADLFSGLVLGSHWLPSGCSCTLIKIFGSRWQILGNTGTHRELWGENGVLESHVESLRFTVTLRVSLGFTRSCWDSGTNFTS